jgi:hypothetical protein
MMEVVSFAASSTAIRAGRKWRSTIYLAETVGGAFQKKMVFTSICVSHITEQDLRPSMIRSGAAR